jgi:hypothetical protein
MLSLSARIGKPIFRAGTAHRLQANFRSNCQRFQHVNDGLTDSPISAMMFYARLVLLARVALEGAYWFRPEKCARGGMSRMIIGLVNN